MKNINISDAKFDTYFHGTVFIWRTKEYSDTLHWYHLYASTKVIQFFTEIDNTMHYFRVDV